MMKKLRNLLPIVILLLAISACNQKQQRDIEIVVHRGANHLAPENTMASTIKCIEMGVAYVEIDVNMSKDSVLYIMHDDELDRTTNGTGKLRDALSADLDKLDAGLWFGEEFEGERVPRVKEYLQAVKGKTKIYFDYKNGDLKKMMDMIYETGFEKDCFIWFGNSRDLKVFDKLSKKVPLKMNAKSVETLQEVMVYNPQIIECDVEAMTPDFVNFCREHNLKIMAYGHDTEEDFANVLNSSADMVNLNKPELMLEMMNK